MRIVIWKQWKTGPKRYWGLRKLGAPEWMAKQLVGLCGLLFELNRPVSNGMPCGVLVSSQWHLQYQILRGDVLLGSSGY